eukprot:gene11555-7962_t
MLHLLLASTATRIQTQLEAIIKNWADRGSVCRGPALHSLQEEVLRIVKPADIPYAHLLHRVAQLCFKQPQQRGEEGEQQRKEEHRLPYTTSTSPLDPLEKHLSRCPSGSTATSYHFSTARYRKGSLPMPTFQLRYTRTFYNIRGNQKGVRKSQQNGARWNAMAVRMTAVAASRDASHAYSPESCRTLFRSDVSNVSISSRSLIGPRELVELIEHPGTRTMELWHAGSRADRGSVCRGPALHSLQEEVLRIVKPADIPYAHLLHRVAQLCFKQPQQRVPGYLVAFAIVSRDPLFAQYFESCHNLSTLQMPKWIYRHEMSFGRARYRKGSLPTPTFQLRYTRTFYNIRGNQKGGEKESAKRSQVERDGGSNDCCSGIERCFPRILAGIMSDTFRSDVSNVVSISSRSLIGPRELVELIEHPGTRTMELWHAGSRADRGSVCRGPALHSLQEEVLRIVKPADIPYAHLLHRVAQLCFKQPQQRVPGCLVAFAVVSRDPLFAQYIYCHNRLSALQMPKWIYRHEMSFGRARYRKGSLPTPTFQLRYTRTFYNIRGNQKGGEKESAKRSQVERDGGSNDCCSGIERCFPRILAGIMSDTFRSDVSNVVSISSRSLIGPRELVELIEHPGTRTMELWHAGSRADRGSVCRGPALHSLQEEVLRIVKPADIPYAHLLHRVAQLCFKQPQQRVRHVEIAVVEKREEGEQQRKEEHRLPYTTSTSPLDPLEKHLSRCPGGSTATKVKRGEKESAKRSQVERDGGSNDCCSGIERCFPRILAGIMSDTFSISSRSLIGPRELVELIEHPGTRTMELWHAGSRADRGSVCRGPALHSLQEEVLRIVKPADIPYAHLLHRVAQLCFKQPQQRVPGCLVALAVVSRDPLFAQYIYCHNRLSALQMPKWIYRHEMSFGRARYRKGSLPTPTFQLRYTRTFYNIRGNQKGGEKESAKRSQVERDGGSNDCCSGIERCFPRILAGIMSDTFSISSRSLIGPRELVELIEHPGTRTMELWHAGSRADRGSVCRGPALHSLQEEVLRIVKPADIPYAHLLHRVAQLCFKQPQQREEGEQQRKEEHRLPYTTSTSPLDPLEKHLSRCPGGSTATSYHFSTARYRKGSLPTPTFQLRYTRTFYNIRGNQKGGEKESAKRSQVERDGGSNDCCSGIERCFPRILAGIMSDTFSISSRSLIGPRELVELIEHPGTRTMELWHAGSRADRGSVCRGPALHSLQEEVLRIVKPADIPYAHLLHRVAQLCFKQPQQRVRHVEIAVVEKREEGEQQRKEEHRLPYTTSTSPLDPLEKHLSRCPGGSTATSNQKGGEKESAKRSQVERDGGSNDCCSGIERCFPRILAGIMSDTFSISSRSLIGPRELVELIEHPGTRTMELWHAGSRADRGSVCRGPALHSLQEEVLRIVKPADIPYAHLLHRVAQLCFKQPQQRVPGCLVALAVVSRNPLFAQYFESYQHLSTFRTSHLRHVEIAVVEKREEGEHQRKEEHRLPYTTSTSPLDPPEKHLSRCPGGSTATSYHFSTARYRKGSLPTPTFQLRYTRTFYNIRGNQKGVRKSQQNGARWNAMAVRMTTVAASRDASHAYSPESCRTLFRSDVSNAVQWSTRVRVLL